MSQLYARVFTKILDSSIAEDFTARHVFEDFLKVCTVGEYGGIVDMTREALARRFNMPLEILNEAISKLEAPDPKSRDQSNEGRRLERLDDHRDWGWRIINWSTYEKIKTQADVAERVAKHRATTSPGRPNNFTPPTEMELDLFSVKIGLPKHEVDKFVNYYEANGWKVGKNKMRSWQHAMSGWKLRWEDNRKPHQPSLEDELDNDPTNLANWKR
jgi:hypothetical protein